MPRLRSGKMVSASEVGPFDSEGAGTGSRGAGCEPERKLVTKQSPRLARKRKPVQSLPACVQPARLASASSGQFAPLVPVQKEQGENSQEFPGKKNKGIQHRKAARSSNGVALPISDTAECEDRQAAGTGAAVDCEETVRKGTGQSQQLISSGSTLQNKFSAGVERKEHRPGHLDLSVFQEDSRSSEKDGKYCCMEIKLQIPSSEEEIESAGRHGISCLPEPEGLQPREVTWSTEMKCTDSVMMQNMKIPDLRENFGGQEAMTETKHREEIDIPEKLNWYPLVGSREVGTQEKEKKCLSKKGGISLMKPKLYGPSKKGTSALLELHAQCPESRKGAVNRRKRARNVLIQGVDGQEQLPTGGKTYKRCVKEEWQSSVPQKGPDNPGENAEEQLKAIEQDSSTSQAVKKVKTEQNRSEGSKEKESHYSKSPMVAALGGTQSKSFLCHAVTKKSGVQYEERKPKERKPRNGQIKHLQSLTAAEKVTNTSVKSDAEHCRNALKHCSGLLRATEKNPSVRLENCSYINTLAKLSTSGTTSSYKLNGFFHVAHPTVEVSDTICSNSRMPNETSPIKDGLLSSKEKNENGEGCLSCSLSESNVCLRGKKWNIGRKPRKKMKITEKSVQNTFIDIANECRECELPAEAAVAMSSSFAASGLNHTLSDSCDHGLNLHMGKNSHEVQNISAWRTKSTKLPAFENVSKKTSELYVMAKGENSSSVAHQSAASGTLRALAQVHDTCDCHKSKTGAKLNNVNKEFQQFTCQRTVPITGKKVWPVESCARTSEWVYKNHGSISGGKRLLKAAFDDCSDKSSDKAVGVSGVTGSLRQLDLHMSSAEITKESAHKRIDPNTECQTSLQTPESSFVDIYKTLRMSNENGESSVSADRSGVAFSHDDVQEVKGTLNFTTKQKEKNGRDMTNRNLSLTVQNGTTKQKDKNEGDVTSRNLSVTIQNGTTKQKDRNEGHVAKRNLSVTVQSGTTKQKDKNEGDLTSRNLSVTIQNGTTKQKDRNEGHVAKRNLSVTVQNGATKQKDKSEGNVTNRNLSVTIQNGTTKQKDRNEGHVAKRNRSVTVQRGTTAGDTKRINFSSKVSVVDRTFSDLKLIKALSPENLTKFRIPLCRNKPESRKWESVHSFERKTCSPLELESSGVSRRQKTGEETILVKSEQHPLPVAGDARSTVSIKKKACETDSKDFQHNGSENFSNGIFVLPENFSAYRHPPLDGQPGSSVPDFSGSDCVLKPSFPYHSWNSVDCLVGLQINDDTKSKGNLSQHRSQNSPDILEAYKQDILVIDVIQDDPDLFGTSNEEELPRACENCPVKVSSTNLCIKGTKQDIKPESPITAEKRYSVENGSGCMQESGMSNDTGNSCDLVLKAEDIKTHNSSRGSSPLGDVTEDFLKDGQTNELDELLKSFDVNEKFKFADGVPDVKGEKKSEAEKSDCKYKDLVNCELLSGSPLNEPKVNIFSEATVMKSWTNGYKPSGKVPLQPLKNYGDFKPQRVEKNATASHSVQQILDALDLPRKYCRYYFMTSRGCARARCRFCHVPEQGDEKICMEILRTYINIKEPGLLKRAVQIFVRYYREVIPGVDFASEVLNDLLASLLRNCLLQEVFWILNVTVEIKTLPTTDVLLKVFEQVASLNLRDAVPTLIRTFRKLTDAGMFLELDHFDYIIKLLHQLQVSSWEISVVLNIKSRFKERHNFEKNWLFDFNLAADEIQHCKEKRDWTKLGTLYLSARTGCECFEDFQKLFLCIAEILTKDSESDRPEVPFCDFADAVMKNSQPTEADRLFIGRTGISVMYSYHEVLQWTKGRKVLDKLHELQIHFTLLKGLIGAERSASRCQIVNKAAEIFLNCGSLDGATRVLRESEWTTNEPLWPCDKMDILSRHNLLCTLVHKYLSKSLYRQAFEVLQNLPGLQKHSDIIDVSQYSCLFNKLINACFENKSLGVSSSAVDFMLSKKITIDFILLRRLITALGRSSLWSKARTYYKNALSLGCYPQLQGNSYHKLLKIPSYLSEVEMLLAIEIFLVSNASYIQSPVTTSQTLQIMLKRCEDQTVQNNSAYQVAVERLILAARLSDPKLFLKHMTMNVNMEEVYSLELSSALKWLQENMKWAEEAWLFQ